MACRVSRPERGAYSTPASAPSPSPAKNHKTPLLSRSDINPPQGRKHDGSTSGNPKKTRKELSFTAENGAFGRCSMALRAGSLEMKEADEVRRCEHANFLRAHAAQLRDLPRY